MQILIGWFSNRTGASIDEGARKSNNWLDQWQSSKLGTWSHIQSLPHAFPLSNDVPFLLLNQPIGSYKRAFVLMKWDVRARASIEATDALVCALEYGWMLYCNHSNKTLTWDIHFISFWKHEFLHNKIFLKKRQFSCWIFIWVPQEWECSEN